MEYTDKRREDLASFGNTLEQLSELMASLNQIETAKAEAASAGQHGRINGYLQQEQALILKLRGLEQHHAKQMKALGWEGLNFRQLLEQADGEEKAVLSPLFDRLTGQLKLLTDSKESSDRILKVRIKEFEEALAGARQPHFHDTYV